jgi:NAD(P)-dependent dehydrogenase (short-subunit alcohol dehydrogenase family)
MKILEGRTAIVTGAARGIGLATSLVFAREGANVVCVDLSPTVSDVSAQIVDAGGKALALVGDVSDEAFVAETVARAVADFGGLAVYHANAGVACAYLSVAEQTVKIWENILRINLISSFLAMKHASRVMIPQGKGVIICTASVVAARPTLGPIPYSASKAAIMNLVQAFANEFRGTGIRVNAVCPGIIMTPATRHLYEASHAAGEESPIGRMTASARDGRPEDVAEAVLFLASDKSSYVNGTGLAVDGGLYSAGMPPG